MRTCNPVFSINDFFEGILGISTVVWDSGLLMVDYLISRKERQIIQSSSPSSSSMPSASNSSLGTCLDLGCGTGVVGIAALLLGADKCVFSDKSITPWYINMHLL